MLSEEQIQNLKNCQIQTKIFLAHEYEYYCLRNSSSSDEYKYKLFHRIYEMKLKAFEKYLEVVRQEIEQYYNSLYARAA